MENNNDVILLLEDKSNLEYDINKYMERVQKLYEKANLCHQMIMEYDNISDQQFYSMLKLLEINSYLTNEDYYNIMGMVNGKKYLAQPVDIMTNMDDTTWEEDVYGSEFCELVGVRLRVLCADVDLDCHRYTKKEINKLLKQRKIVILQKLEGTPSYQNKTCPPYEEILTSAYKLFENKNGKYHNSMIKYVRKEVTKEKLREILNNLLSLLKKEVSSMENSIKEFNEQGFQKKIGELEK